MKLLKDILYRVRIQELIGTTNIAVPSICFDSRKATGDSLFVAVKGVHFDGHNFIKKAIESGAKTIVLEELPFKIDEDITYVKVENSAEALGYIAANFYDNPSEKLKLTGITGTNGKTTTTTLLYNLFRLLGLKTGLLSTVENKINHKTIPATHTTPDPIALNELLAQMVAAGCEYCFMEVSSHAIHQHRITGLNFDIAVFTNISRDHLDYHETFNEYIKAKKAFFDHLPSTAYALMNRDDKHSATMIQNTRAKVKSFAVKSMSDYKAKVIENQFNGLQLEIEGNQLYTKLIGGFNAYNILTVYGVANLLKLDKLDILTSLSTLNSVEGRFQYIKTTTEITGVVDYAHTPDALKNVLKTINEIRTNNEQLITVIGCGGDRDTGKRPIMAEIACELSNKVVFTSDNPRTEQPEAIIKDMEKGVAPEHYKKTISITNRKEAIKIACSMSEPGDIILIAGKGHEKYQEINGERFPFDDMQVLNETLKMLEK